MFGETLRYGERPEFRFIGCGDPDRDARRQLLRNARRLQVIEQQDIRDFEQTVIARGKFLVEAHVHQRAHFDSGWGFAPVKKFSQRVEAGVAYFTLQSEAYGLR